MARAAASTMRSCVASLDRLPVRFILRSSYSIPARSASGISAVRLLSSDSTYCGNANVRLGGSATSATALGSLDLLSSRAEVVFATDDAAPQSMLECRRRRRAMAAIDDVWLAALTKDEDDAESRNQFNLTVNIDGDDVYLHDFLLGWNLIGQGVPGLHEGQAGLEEGKPPPAPFDSDKLTNSSVRLGLRGDDAWAPKHVMVIGRAQPDFMPGRFLALAMETEIERWLSADGDEGRLTMPVRRVSAGTSNTIIRRVLLLIYTDRGDNVDTESDIKLQIVASGQLMLDQKTTHDPKDDRPH